jgi:hypothetical protein
LWLCPAVAKNAWQIALWWAMLAVVGTQFISLRHPRGLGSPISAFIRLERQQPPEATSTEC